MNPTPHPRWLALWLGLGLLLALCAYPFLGQAVFSDDDGHILQLAIDAPYLGAYYLPEVYQQLSVVHYTPVALTVYRLMLEIFGLSATAFVLLQLSLLGLCAGLAAAWCHRQSQHTSAGLMVLVLIASLSSVWPMAARFYTLHYVIGGVFSLLLLLQLQALPTGTRAQQGRALARVGALALAALLSKEVFAPLVFALIGLSVLRRQSPRALVLMLAMLVYAGLRLQVLGFSTEGRMGNSLLGDLFALQASTLKNFAHWYVQTHALLLCAALLALWRQPARTLQNTLMASLLVLPVLAAPHAIQDPTLHADRLFFAFDLALCCAIVLALHARAPSANTHRWWPLLVLPLALLNTHPAMARKQQQLATDPAQHITRHILAARPDRPLTILTDTGYMQGGLMRVMALQRTHPHGPLHITQNCQQALLAQRQGHTLWTLDAQGQTLDPTALAQRCQTLTAHGPTPVAAPIAPAFVRGLLQWQLTAPEGLQVGVEFPDRGMSIDTPQMHQRLVRPRPNEPYRLYARQGPHWWYSELRHMEVLAHRP